MRCVVIATEKYMNDAKSYNCIDVFDRMKSKIEQECDYQGSNLVAYGGFENGTYFKKRHENYRSVFIRRKMMIGGKDEVYCYLALCVFKRGDSRYETFMHAQTSTAMRESITGLNKVDWKSIENEISIGLTSDIKEKSLPELNEEEKSFIQTGNGITQEIFDTPVYESEAWIESVRKETFNDFSKVADAIIDAACNSDHIGYREIPYGDNGEKIACAMLMSDDAGSKKAKDGWFLLGLGKDDVMGKIRKEFFPNGAALPSREELAAKCRRAYPFKMMMDDEDFWRAMEKDKDSNFILSDEEIDIVEKPLTFPLFLTGRAGSGKSTMLQYLFADYFLRYCEHDGVLPPVYLSYSENLIDNAKKLSESLFGKNHAYSERLKKTGRDFRAHIEPEFENVFFVFHQLVRDCIGMKNREVLRTRFSMDKHVSYSKFRELWNRKFGKDPKAGEKYGPDLSWHVIRTFIKGWNPNDYCDLYDYEDIGRANKSVSDDTFGIVYDKVWKGWYEKEQDKEGYWDDQDLIRYCLSPDDESCDTCVSERFSAIFCDESQDFTRLETEFILRLSLFSNRRIYNENTLNQLPFVFAGDEFQTLNPTGFSWDSLRSYFTERLIRATDLPKCVGAPEPVVLKKNYRSTAPIVKLSNRLQLLREARCGKGGSQSTPQIPYNVESNAASVYCLSPRDAMVWNKLKEMNAVLIIPAAEGQAPKNFIDQSPISGMIDFYEDGSSVGITIYNPLQAKGLEYPCVAVYGFDDIAPKSLRLKKLEKWLESSGYQDDKESDEIDLKYFLSNAYVSITRAKSKLFILSDCKGAESLSDLFWSFAFSQDDRDSHERIHNVEEMMLSKLKHPEFWSSHDGEPLLGYIIKGDVGSVTGENIVDLREAARIAEERGKTLYDPRLMRQAAARYRERGMIEDENRCYAYSYEYERDFSKAAEFFIKAKKYDEAVSCLWRSYSGSDLDGFLRSLTDLASDSLLLEVKVAQRCMSSHPSLEDLKSDLYDLLAIFSRKDNDQAKILACETRLTWRDVFLRMFDLIAKVSVNQQEAVKPLIEICTKLETYGIDLSHRIPKIAFDAGLYEDAIRLWERKPTKEKSSISEYHQAKCKVLDYPEDITHWELSGIASWQDNVVREYHEDNGAHAVIDPNARKVLETALLTAGDADERRSAFLYLLGVANGIGEAQSLLKKASDSEIGVARECFDALFLIRWGDLNSWSGKNLSYRSDSLNKLVTIIDKVKYVRSSQFMQLMSESFRDGKRYVSDVMTEEFGEFNRVIWNPLLLAEIGIVMERRGYFVDAARFYEWAQRQTDDYETKREMAIRWIVCKERQADVSANSDEIMNDAARKRDEIGLAFDYEIPLAPKFERWGWLYGELLKIDPEKNKIRVNVTKKEQSPVKDAKPQTMHSADTHSNPFKVTNPIGERSVSIGADGGRAMPKFPSGIIGGMNKSAAFESKIVSRDIGDYKFKYNASRGELSISLSDDQEDLHIKIKKGVFPSDADFFLRGNRLMKSDTNEETPFLLELSENNVRVIDATNGKHYDFAF